MTDKKKTEEDIVREDWLQHPQTTTYLNGFRDRLRTATWLLIQAAEKSTDPIVRDLYGRLHVTLAMAGEFGASESFLDNAVTEGLNR